MKTDWERTGMGVRLKAGIHRQTWIRSATLLFGLAMAPVGIRAQSYIGYVYPAGGRQGESVRIEMGGQQLDGVDRAWISGPGVTAKVVEYNKQMGPQEVRILRDQLDELKKPASGKRDPAHAPLVRRIENLIRDHVTQPACAAIANRVIVEVSLAPNAPPGRREIRVGGTRGLSNPMPFYVGDIPEISRPVLPTTPLAILGKEEQSLRRPTREAAAKPATDQMAADAMMADTMMADTMMAAMMDSARPPSALDGPILALSIPCTVNGQ
ncbi:MAG: hypothetical protein U1E27_09300, partial [Kiritimatiellia bacterium]|nr:hypothetical protein [Kiritimatiellia bacterium]